MKLIIDIDKDYYKAIWENGYIYDEDNEDIAKIIKDGTPLEEEFKKIKAEIEDTGAYEQEVSGKTEFLKGITYCLNTIDKHISELKGE